MEEPIQISQEQMIGKENQEVILVDSDEVTLPSWFKRGKIQFTSKKPINIENHPATITCICLFM
jgi:hypothetical protein